MYSQLPNIVNDLIPAATEYVIDNDRMMYKPFFETAERFCSEQRVLIGGRMGVFMLTDEDDQKASLPRDLYMWDLFTDDIFNTAKALSDALARTVSPHVPNNTVALQTNIKYREYSLYIYARLCFRIFDLDKYRGMKLIDVMKPPTCRGFFTRLPIMCISPEMQLIDSYRVLYSPSGIDRWEDELMIERKLFALTVEQNVGTNGGLDGCMIEHFEGGLDVEPLSPDWMERLVNVVRKSSHVIIGEYALRLALGDKSIKPSRIQVITSDDIESVRKLVEKALLGRHAITSVRYGLNIASDFQLTKHTIYAQAREQIPLMDVFNSTQFELVPYVSIGHIRVGAPFVILRWLFIDNWVLSLVAKMSKANGLSYRIRDNLQLAVRLREFCGDNLFVMDNYAGVYINESVAKKKLIKDLGQRFPPYYPAMISHVNGGMDVLTSRAISPEITDGKIAVLKKITGIDLGDKSIQQAITQWTQTKSHLHTQWGINKVDDPLESFRRNEGLFRNLAYLGNSFTLIDFGCGDGNEARAIAAKYPGATVTCMDVSDTRKDQSMSFQLITPGQPMERMDASVDAIMCIHVIHHMMDSVPQRIQDFARVTRMGGLLLIRDHDVQDRASADIVDFEHFVYLMGESNSDINTSMRDFGSILPMKYYSRAEVDEMICAYGYVRVWWSHVNPVNFAYSAVYRRK